jgi:hypothetical protein
MAGVGYLLSQHVYPIPFEKGRLARLGIAAVLAFFLSLAAPVPKVPAAPDGERSVHFFVTAVAPALAPAVGVKTLMLGAFPLLIVALGVVRREEWSWLRGQVSRF